GPPLRRIRLEAAAGAAQTGPGFPGLSGGKTGQSPRFFRPVRVANAILISSGPSGEKALRQRREPNPTLGRPSHPPPARRILDPPRNLKIEGVSRLHPTPPLHLRAEQSVAEAVALMRQHGVGCVLVCQSQRLVGIFTERDLMSRVLAARAPLSL